jgi:hypothetical protein
MILHKIQFYIKIAMVMSYGSLFLLFIIFHTFTVLRKIEGWKILRFWLSGGRAGRPFGPTRRATVSSTAFDILLASPSVFSVLQLSARGETEGQKSTRIALNFLPQK